MPRGRPVVNRLELNAEQTASLKAIANSRSDIESNCQFSV